MLTWLGDDVEIPIRPRLQRTKRGALRVLQAAAVEKPDDFEPVRDARADRRLASTPRGSSDRDTTTDAATGLSGRDDRPLLGKHAIQKITCLAISTIYRRMSEGTFPQPLRIGPRRALAYPKVRKYVRPGLDPELWFEDIVVLSHLVSGERELKGVSKDPDDDKYIAAATEGRAGFVVAGDSDLLDVKEFEGIRIISPRAFLDLIS